METREPITVLDRNALYELVWSEPTTQLARRYAISDVALAKLCKAMDVPKPGRGYWAQLKRGKAAARPILPALTSRTRTEAHVRSRGPATETPNLRARGPEIEVPDQIENPHRIVRELQSRLSRARADGRGMLTVRGSKDLVVEVSANQKDRALRILNALLRAIEQRGHCVAKRLEDGLRPSITVAGEGLSLKLKERLLQSPHTLTIEEQASEQRYGRSYAPQFDHNPSGRLRLRVCRADGTGGEATWSESDRRRLERRVGDMVVGLEALAESIKENRRRSQEERRRFEEEWARREAEARRLQLEKKRFEELRSDAARWKEAQVMREYLDAVERACSERGDRGAMTGALAWARKMVEAFDPLSRTGNLWTEGTSL